MARSFFFKPRATPQPVAASRIPDGTVLWAVGDIHGRLDLLDALLPEILRDLDASSQSRRLLVFLGDYIDRGPDSRGVLDRLCDLRDIAGVETHFLRGNHEERMEAFLDDPELGPGWCDYGGREALRSYDVPIPVLKADPEAWAAASAAFGDALPDRHRAFLSSQESSFMIGDYFFAHAGARPGVALHEQKAEDLMWIRQGFLNDRTAFEKVVVHGHSPVETVHADHRRIAIDTGAYATNVLTGLKLEGDTRHLLQTRRAGARIETQLAPLAP